MNTKMKAGDKIRNIHTGRIATIEAPLEVMHRGKMIVIFALTDGSLWTEEALNENWIYVSEGV